MLKDHLAVDDQMMMRLIDDFLMITTQQPRAIGFLRTMHKGAAIVSLAPLRNTSPAFPLYTRSLSLNMIEHD